MKEEVLIKVKTTKTLYLDCEDNMWYDEDPKQYSGNWYYKCGKDYEVLRKGSVLYGTYYDLEEDESIGLSPKNKGQIIVMPSLGSIKTSDWFEVIR